MKKLLAIILATIMVFSCTSAVFAAGNMSSWFKSSTAQTMQITDADENLMEYDKRINPMNMLYGIYEFLGEAEVDVSKVEAPFSDISIFEPYSKEREAITWLYLKGIVKGYGDGTVRASKEVTRAEFIKMLTTMLEETNSIRVTTGTSNPYNDINGHWAYDEILKATHTGLVQGDGKSFNPDTWITKEEVITIGLRLADKLEMNINDYADIVDEIYDIHIDYPIYTDGWGEYDYSEYDYVINLDDYENVYFPNITSISSYTTSRSGIVTVSKYTNYLKVTAKEEGTVTITAKSKNGYKQSLKILVVDKYANTEYTVRVGSTQKVYHPDRGNIRSYDIISGSSYITVSKYTNYLSVKGKKAGTAKIKIVDTYGISETVTVRVNSTTSSGYDDYYYADSGETIKVYPTSGRNISSYYVSSGGSYVSVSKYSSYLSVYCRNEGTAKIRITDTYGDTETITVYINDDYYYEDDGRDYGLTDTVYLERGAYDNLYFKYIDDIYDTKMSKSGIVSVTEYDGYIRVYAKAAGTVTITGYDRYGDSERIRVVVDNHNDYDEEYDYGVTSTEHIYGTQKTKIYFKNLDGDLVDYEVSTSNMVYVKVYDDYITVEGRSGKSGSVTITVFDEYGSSEAVKVRLYDTDNDSSEPPYRDVIYPPDYEVDISK
ncbi:MAG: hypothetical protein E7311_03485 [Clostridiales bacterium]|nr:hypothetical protein [Clostridiales bacterium]